MKKPTLLPVLALFAILLLSCSTDSEDSNSNSNDNATTNTSSNTNTGYTVPTTKTIEIEILELINNHRISAGLNSLQSMSAIKGQAYSHTDYMIDQNNISHDFFGNRRSYLVNNVSAVSVAENVAYGYSSAEAVVVAWLNSPSHREAIEADFTHFDISAEKNTEGQWYFTNIFVKR
ncbi:MAG: CAP domain-containing protein [Oceanihabitans sp.]